MKQQYKLLSIVTLTIATLIIERALGGPLAHVTDDQFISPAGGHQLLANRTSGARELSAEPKQTSTNAPNTENSDTSTPQPSTESSANSGGLAELPDFTSSKNTSTFSCQGKINGYYADVKLGCRVYHFCTRLDGLDEVVYQRMSYICLEGSVFDQKDLNCVNERELKIPCERAEEEYDSSNRQFDTREESQPSMSDSLTANLMMNPITRFIAGR